MNKIIKEHIKNLIICIVVLSSFIIMKIAFTGETKGALSFFIIGTCLTFIIYMFLQ